MSLPNVTDWTMALQNIVDKVKNTKFCIRYKWCWIMYGVTNICWPKNYIVIFMFSTTQKYMFVSCCMIINNIKQLQVYVNNEKGDAYWKQGQRRNTVRLYECVPVVEFPCEYIFFMCFAEEILQNFCNDSKTKYNLFCED